jgi:hypothetical protein
VISRALFFGAGVHSSIGESSRGEYIWELLSERPARIEISHGLCPSALQIHAAVLLCRTADRCKLLKVETARCDPRHHQVERFGHINGDEVATFGSDLGNTPCVVP